MCSLLRSRSPHLTIPPCKGTKIVGAHSIEEMCAKLKKPRRVMMLVKAGKPVDDFIDQVVRVGGGEQGWGNVRAQPCHMLSLVASAGATPRGR